MPKLRLLISLLIFCAPTFSADYYIATNGNDRWSGKLDAPNPAKTDGPFASVAKAQVAVRDLLRKQPQAPVTVMLRQGSYFLPLSPTEPGILNFTPADSGTDRAPVTWQNYPGENPVISGGEATGKGGLGLTWTKASGNLWQVTLPESTRPFEYLFYNGERRLRSRVQSASGVGYYMKEGACYSTVTKERADASLCNLGTYLRVSEVHPAGANAGCPSVTNAQNPSQSKCLDRFAYSPGDPIGEWANLNPSGSLCGGNANAYPAGDIEITLFDSWTVDVMRVSCVDTVNRIVYFTGKTKANPRVYVRFGPTAGHRYIVENTRDAFDAAARERQTGIWFLDRSTSPRWTLNYLANKRENPNSDAVVIAQLQPLAGAGTDALPQGGSLLSATGLSHVTFRGLTFEVDNFVPAPTGFNNDENSDDTLPSAVDCENCTSVTFDRVSVRHTSASGILIAATAGAAAPSNNAIRNSAFYDIGDCGIRIGHQLSRKDTPENVIHGVTIENNIIQGYSRVFADGEGISLSNGHDVLVSHNDITDGYHAGISICEIGCISHQANGVNIVSRYNHLWNIMQGVTSDGGTLYYHTGGIDGSGSGNFILNNLVHDTTDSVIIDPGVVGSAYGGHGIYIDDQTGAVGVENNVVYRVSGSAVSNTAGPVPGVPANTLRNNIFAYARKSMFTESNPWPKGCDTTPGPSLRIAFTNNIFYFDLDDTSRFSVTQGCAYTCGLSYDQFQKFEGNLYWRTDGGFATYNRQFHVLKDIPPNAVTCSGTGNPGRDWVFLDFAAWQSNRQPAAWGPAGGMNEDLHGTVTVNPGFGSTGKPEDFLLKSDPVPGLLDHTKTNDTILHAGREHPELTPAVPHTVAPTFPAYSYAPIAVTIQTIPAGLQFQVDGGRPQKAPQTVYLPQDGKHELSIVPVQSLGGKKYSFERWSDNESAAARVFAVGDHPATITASFR